MKWKRVVWVSGSLVRKGESMAGKKEAAPPVGPTVIEEIREKQMRAKLKVMLERRIELKLEADKINGERTALDADLQLLYMKLGVKTFVHNGFAIPMVESEGRASLDKKKLKEVLLKKGVPMAKIEAAFEEATSMGAAYSCIQVRQLKTESEDE